MAAGGGAGGDETELGAALAAMGLDDLEIAYTPDGPPPGTALAAAAGAGGSPGTALGTLAAEAKRRVMAAGAATGARIKQAVGRSVGSVTAAGPGGGAELLGDEGQQRQAAGVNGNGDDDGSLLPLGAEAANLARQGSSRVDYDRLLRAGAAARARATRLAALLGEVPSGGVGLRRL